MGEYGDMVEMGILDPTKVTRLALLNAAPVAGLLLMTEVMIAELPTEDEYAHGAPGGGTPVQCLGVPNPGHNSSGVCDHPSLRNHFIRNPWRTRCNRGEMMYVDAESERC